MMVVVVEGIDRVGKTTLAKMIFDELGYVTFKDDLRYVGGRLYSNVNVEKMNTILNAVESGLIKDIVLDRFHLSEYVYGKLDRCYDTNIHLKIIARLKSISEYNDVVYVLVEPTDLKNSSKEHGLDLSKHASLFLDALQHLNGCNVVRCNYKNLQDAVDFIKSVKSKPKRTYKRTLCVDVDDTICTVKNRDYENAIPNVAIINKLNNLSKNCDTKIIYATSRGMNSCDSDVHLAELKNRPVLEKWLKDNNVIYNELVFGIPFADKYINDKGQSNIDFMSQLYYRLSGGSGCEVFRFGDVVKKTYKNKDEMDDVVGWVEQSESNGFRLIHPKIRSIQNTNKSSVFMDFVDGRRLCNVCKQSVVANVIESVISSSRINPPYDKNEFDGNVFFDILKSNMSGDSEMNDIVMLSQSLYLSIKDTIKDEQSFCHGDLTLSNLIYGEDGIVYSVDPRVTNNSSSYLFDLAKLKMSLLGYDIMFGFADESIKCEYEKALRYLDLRVRSIGKSKEVDILTLCYIARLYRYKKGFEKELVKKFAKEVIADYEKKYELC